MKRMILLATALLLSAPILLGAAPAVGEAPPKVSAKKHLSDETIDLSSVEKPTVIVFGSHT